MISTDNKNVLPHFQPTGLDDIEGVVDAWPQPSEKRNTCVSLKKNAAILGCRADLMTIAIAQMLAKSNYRILVQGDSRVACKIVCEEVRDLDGEIKLLVRPFDTLNQADDLVHFVARAFGPMDSVVCNLPILSPSPKATAICMRNTQRFCELSRRFLKTERLLDRWLDRLVPNSGSVVLRESQLAAGREYLPFGEVASGMVAEFLDVILTRHGARLAIYARGPSVDTGTDVTRPETQSASIRVHQEVDLVMKLLGSPNWTRSSRELALIEQRRKHRRIPSTNHNRRVEASHHEDGSAASEKT